MYYNKITQAVWNEWKPWGQVQVRMVINYATTVLLEMKKHFICLSNVFEHTLIIFSIFFAQADKLRQTSEVNWSASKRSLSVRHQINTDFRSEFARSLEPLLLLGQRCPPSIVGSASVAMRWQTRLHVSATYPPLNPRPSLYTPSLGEASRWRLFRTSPWHRFGNHFFPESKKVWMEKFHTSRRSKL